jgi:hypothetical protein
MQKKVKGIIKDLSLRLNIPEKDVEEIVKSQFLFTKRMIESAEKDNEESFKIVQLPSFGKFMVPPNLINKIIKSKKKKKNGN